MMKITKVILIIVVLMLGIFNTDAQTYMTGRTVISALGGSYSTGTYAGDFTIGQLAIATELGESGRYINQGFHVGPVISVKVDDVKPLKSTLKAFPNPVKTDLTITFNGLDDISIDLKFYSLSGKMVKMLPMNKSRILIDMSDLQSGTYFIHAINKDSKKRINTLKIQKL